MKPRSAPWAIGMPGMLWARLSGLLIGGAPDMEIVGVVPDFRGQSPSR